MANENIITLTKDNFENEVLKCDKPVMVDFWAGWCGPCRAVSPIMDELSIEFQGKVKVGKINVDEESELSSKFRIMSIPTVMVFKDGQTVDKIVGARSKDDFVRIIDKSL